MLAHIKASGCPLESITTLTTRPKRPNEREGVDYHFVSEADFQDMLKKDALLEHAHVYGNWYGVPKEAVRESLKQGRDTIVKVDTQGAAAIKEIAPQAVFIFIVTQSREELHQRLKGRSTETEADLAIRIKAVEEEIGKLHLFDYVVVNRQDRLDLAAAEIEAIITAEKCRAQPRQVDL